MKYLILFLVSLISILASAQEVASKQERYNSLFTRQELFQNKYKQAYQDLTDINRNESLKIWYRLMETKTHDLAVFKKTMGKANSIILGKDYRELLYYYTLTGQTEQASNLVGLYIMSLHTLLDNLVNDPQNKFWKTQLTAAIGYGTKRFKYREIKRAEDCYKEIVAAPRGYNISLAKKMVTGLRRCVFKNSQINPLIHLVQLLFRQEHFHGAPYPVTFSGFVKGNTVEVLNKTPMDQGAIENLGSQLNLILTAVHPTLEKYYSKMSVEDFKSVMPTPESAITNFFTEEEGFKHREKHLSFAPLKNGEFGIYSQMLEAVQNAKESVFIDIFWMGGSIGMNLARELIKKVNADPEFTVYIITDSDNKFEYAPQLDFIYNYMRAYSENFPENNFLIAPAKLNLKRTALPEFFDLLITNSVIEDAKKDKGLHSLLEKDGFHLLAKSDHTKVIVVDGKNPKLGKAYVGSKNWTDGSGGVNFDEVAEIKGPAVGLILNSFYNDALEAFLEDRDPHSNLEKDQKKMILAHLNAKFPEEKISFKNKVKKLMIGMDVLDRHRFNKNIALENINVPYVEQEGSDTVVVAPAQNNIYGTEISALEQNIQTILSAKHQIIIDDQFLYDPAVVEALKFVKKTSNVKIYIMLETLQALDAENNYAAHIPNNLFIPDFVKLGVPVKWKIVTGAMKSQVLAEKEKYGNTFSTTFHVKSISTDGVLEEDQSSCSQIATAKMANLEDSMPVLITGSANKDIMTMSGGFREYQTALYGSKPVAQHDCLFWQRWNDSSQTVSTDGLDFEIPLSLQDAGIKDEQTLLDILKMTFFSTYNFTKDYFN